MFEKIQKGIDLVISFIEKTLAVIARLLFEVAPLLFVGFVIVAVVVKVFKVVVLGEQP